ncbi:MAG: hypothetical protein KAH77_04405, partial [Thiomargarita sp.]|nr:hypothetical protein [Thiomargarita sp.]
MSIEQEVEEFARNMINFHGFRFIEGFACLIPDQAKYPKNEGLYLWGFSEKRMRFETKVEKFHAPARIQRMADMLGVPEKEYKKQFLVLLQDYLTILKNLGFTNIGKGVHLFGKTRIHNLQGDIKLFENNFDRLKQLEQITLNNPILTFVEEHAYFDVNNQDTLVWDSSFGNKPSSKTSKVAKKATATKVTKSTKATVTKNTKTTAAKVTKGTK